MRRSGPEDNRSSEPDLKPYNIYPHRGVPPKAAALMKIASRGEHETEFNGYVIRHWVTSEDLTSGRYEAAENRWRIEGKDFLALLGSAGTTWDARTSDPVRLEKLLWDLNRAHNLPFGDHLDEVRNA